jgi:hypothetical protein
MEETRPSAVYSVLRGTVFPQIDRHSILSLRKNRRSAKFEWGSANYFEAGVKGNGSTMHHEVTSQGFKIEFSALAENEMQLHQAARRVVDEDQQGTWLTPILKPAMLTPIDLDQLSKAFPSQAGLMEHAPEPHVS